MLPRSCWGSWQKLREPLSLSYTDSLTSTWMISDSFSTMRAEGKGESVYLDSCSCIVKLYVASSLGDFKSDWRLIIA